MNVDIVYSTKPEQVWPLVAPGIEKSLAYGEVELDLDDVAAAVLHGIFTLWVIEGDGRYLGVLVTEVNQGASKKWINVVAAFISPGADKTAGADVLEVALTGLGAWAAGQGAGLRAYSVRPGMGRRLVGLGWRKRFTEYVKES